MRKDSAILFRVDPRTRAQLNRLARVQDCSRSEVIRRLINDAYAYWLTTPNGTTTDMEPLEAPRSDPFAG